MKKGIILISVVTSFLAVIVGCGDKDNDFRDKWLGTYEGYCDYHASLSYNHQIDTVYTNESLTVHKQGSDGLVMDYLGQSFQVRCSQNGIFTSTTDNPHSDWHGFFRRDSLYFDYQDVSQGHSTTRHFKGKKL